MSLASRLTALVQAIGADIKALKLADETRRWAAVSSVQTQNVNIASAIMTITPPAPAVQVGQRVLLMGQTDKTQNGIWVFAGAGNPMTRATDADDTLDFVYGKAVFLYSNTRLYRYTGPDQPTLGTTQLTFQLISTNAGYDIKELEGIESSLTDHDTKLTGVTRGIAEPCMAVYTTNVDLTAEVISANLRENDRVLLTAQNVATENGVYTLLPDTGLGAFFQRDPDELYWAGRLFPVVTKSVLGLDDDYANPVIYACADFQGSDPYKFTLVATATAPSGGGSTTGAVAPVMTQGYRNAALSIGTGSIIVLDGEDAGTDPLGFHDPVSGQFKIPAGYDGTYLIVGKITYQQNTGGGYRGISIRKNSAEIDSARAAAAPTANTTAPKIATIAKLAAGDIIEMAAAHGESGAIALNSGSTATYLQIVRLVDNPAQVPEVDTPIFRAYLSANTAAIAQTAKIPFDKIIGDSHGWFSTANSRYQPQKAGWYRITATAEPNGLPANAVFEIDIRKNGVRAAWGSNALMGAANPAAVATDLIYLNGTTDYVEINVWNSTGNSVSITGDANGLTTYFSGEFVASGLSNPARRIKGKVNADGTIAAGQGLFTVVRNGTGDYTVTFAKAFSAAPVVDVTPSGAANHAKLYNGSPPTTTTMRVSSFGYSGAGAAVQTDGAFEFVAEDAGLGLQATMDVEGWNASKVTYVTGMATYTTGPAVVPAQVRKTPDGKVHMRGEIVSSAGFAANATLFTITDPLYRPTTRQRFPVYTNQGVLVLSVEPTGAVNCTAATTSGALFNLSPISFFPDA